LFTILSPPHLAPPIYVYLYDWESTLSLRLVWGIYITSRFLDSRNVMSRSLYAKDYKYAHVWFEYEPNKILRNMRFPHLVFSYESYKNNLLFPKYR
jgi:hypothetical protein